MFKLPPSDRAPSRSELSKIFSALLELQLSRSAAASWAEGLLRDNHPDYKAHVAIDDDVVAQRLMDLVAFAEEIPLAWLPNGPRVPMFHRQWLLWQRDLLEGRPPLADDVRSVLAEMHAKSTSHVWACSWAREWVGHPDKPAFDPYVAYVLKHLASRGGQQDPLWADADIVRLLEYDQTL